MHGMTAKLLMGAAALAVFAGCAKKAEEPAADAAAQAEAPAGPSIAPLRATGNEPGWRIDVSDDAIVMTTPEGETRTGAPVLDTVFADGAVLYVATGDAGEIAVKVSDQLCVDTMSGMPHPQRVQVWTGGQELKGCGGEPASLLQGGEWTVDQIAGKAPVKDSKVTLDFAAAGSLSGSSGCNRLATTYALTGESLSIQQGAGTMMMCEQPLMDQEKAFLALLSEVSSFGFTDDGALLLKAGQKRTIRARR